MPNCTLMQLNYYCNEKVETGIRGIWYQQILIKLFHYFINPHELFRNYFLLLGCIKTLSTFWSRFFCTPPLLQGRGEFFPAVRRRFSGPVTLPPLCRRYSSGHVREARWESSLHGLPLDRLEVLYSRALAIHDKHRSVTHTNTRFGLLEAQIIVLTLDKIIYLTFIITTYSLSVCRV